MAGFYHDMICPNTSLLMKCNVCIYRCFLQISYKGRGDLGIYVADNYQNLI